MKLLIVEDEPKTGDYLKQGLGEAGFVTDLARDGWEGLELAKDGHYDLLILDIMLPGLDGWQVLEGLRRAGVDTPVLFLTARDRVEDRVKGLELGADDYLVKPFELTELLARVRSMLRRRNWERDGGGRRQALLEFDHVRADFDTHEVTVHGEAVKLTQLELDLLRYFAENPGRVLSRKELLEKVWKLRNYGEARTVDNFISRLRRVLEKNPKSPRYLLSVRGAGYRFLPDG